MSRERAAGRLPCQEELSARRFPAHRLSTFECCLSIWWGNRGNSQVIPGPTCLKETLSRGFRQNQKSLREVAGDRDSVGLPDGKDVLFLFVIPGL